MGPQKSVLVVLFIGTFYIAAFVSAVVHKGYSHTAIHNKHGGKFAYKIHHVYHPKKDGHGHGGGGGGGGGHGGGGHGHKHSTTLYHRNHDDIIIDNNDDTGDYEGGGYDAGGYRMLGNYKGSVSGLEGYGTGYPSLNSYNTETFGSPYKSNLLDDDSYNSDYKRVSGKSYRSFYPRSQQTDYEMNY